MGHEYLVWWSVPGFLDMWRPEHCQCWRWPGRADSWPPARGGDAESERASTDLCQLQENSRGCRRSGECLLRLLTDLLET